MLRRIISDVTSNKIVESEFVSFSSFDKLSFETRTYPVCSPLPNARTRCLIYVQPVTDECHFSSLKSQSSAHPTDVCHFSIRKLKNADQLSCGIYDTCRMYCAARAALE